MLLLRKILSTRLTILKKYDNIKYKIMKKRRKEKWQIFMIM